jgi:membrane protease YdiL (CAAX protease family)
MLSSKLRAPGVVALWLALTHLLPLHLATILPDAVRSALSLDVYLAICQLLSTAAGLGAWRLLGAGPLPAGGAGGVGRAVALAPAVFVASLAAGIYVALPTLLAEFQRGGAQVSQQNLGEFGKVLKQAPLAFTLLWVAVIAPIGEELVFRGGLWGAVAALLAPGEAPPEAPPASEQEPALPIDEGAGVRAARWALAALRSGGAATLVSAAVFAAMHLGTPGGAGIIRVVSAALLGLALGATRQATGGLIAPVALHAAYNVLGLGHARGWFVTEDFPKDYGVPRLLTIAAGAGLVVAVALAIGARMRRGPAPVGSEASGE